MSAGSLTMSSCSLLPFVPTAQNASLVHRRSVDVSLWVTVIRGLALTLCLGTRLPKCLQTRGMVLGVVPVGVHTLACVFFFVQMDRQMNEWIDG